MNHGEEEIDDQTNMVSIAKLIEKRIDALRPKLLDLTRRNPLISTKFSDRSNSLIRLVDQSPESILNFIIAKKMRIVPLPDLQIDPKDEQTREFQSALTEARLNDEFYSKRLDEIDQSSDNAPDLLAQVERQLKDHLREKLNMPQRQTKNNLSLQQHAKNNGISPNYELRHDDHSNIERQITDIQTLLLPDVLERRLNALCSKEKTWKNEAGISVLHGAFGFLEWQDGNNSSVQFSPLLLLPVQIEKKRSNSGQEFWVHSDEGELQENKILAEKMRLEFNIILPEYVGQGAEKYFEEVGKQGPKNMIWRIRRWAVIGVFPSARLAMYHDIDPDAWDFRSHEIISKLFGGTEAGHDAAPFGDEYEIDEPEIESKVPYLITDADSSQFSTIVDIMDGKCLAVEGPPGTGKSQTIVNTIAAALEAGRKVLFVAEKSAALEVVQARLEAFGLGNFLLPLQANRASKEQIVSSIRDRIEMQSCANPTELGHAIEEFKKTRSHLQSYIDTISSCYGETDFTIHKILGMAIKYSDLITSLPEDIKNFTFGKTKQLSINKLEEILHECEQVGNVYSETLKQKDCWKNIRFENVDPFKAADLLDMANKASQLYEKADFFRQELEIYRCSKTLNYETLKIIAANFNNLPEKIPSQELDVIEKLTSIELVDFLKNFLQDAHAWREKRSTVVQYITQNLDETVIENISKINELLDVCRLESLSDEIINLALSNHRKNLENYKNANEIYQQAVSVSEEFAVLRVSELIKILDLISAQSKQTLAVRNKVLDDFNIQTLFVGKIENLRKLRKQRSHLKKWFVSSPLIMSENLNQHLSTITCAGIFSFLSPDYRKAKKIYHSISIDPKFEKKEAISRLQRLCVWINDLHIFLNDEIIKKICGPYFNGLDTDFLPFEAVIKYFQELEKILPGEKFADLRDFLKHAEINKLQDLPSVNPGHSIHALDDFLLAELAEKIPNLEHRLKTYEDNIKELNRLKTVFLSPNNISNSSISELLQKMVMLIEMRDRLRKNSKVENILGSLFKAEETYETELVASICIANSLILLDEKTRESVIYCMREGKLADFLKLISKIIEADQNAFSALEKLADETNTVASDWVGRKSYKECSALLASAAEDKDGLILYSRLFSAKKNIEEETLKPIVDVILSNDHINLRETIEALIVREMAREVYNVHGILLARYNGDDLNDLRMLLKETDHKVAKLSRQYLQSKLFKNARPPAGNGLGRKSDFSELALLKHEISKKQRHSAVRTLTKRAAKALQELKPCWMMSPLAVAQYLPRSGIEFDLVIIDEASQMTPEDSIGALLRAKQAMVVGDTNQLPPTNFFRKILEDDDADEDEKTTEESILEIANCCFKPARRLRWHYRSKNSSLISFSNKHVYNNDLVIFPSAEEENLEMGVSYRKVDGLYSSGVNPKEAAFMVDSIISFMKEHANRSLGVVVLNQKQRDLLREEIDYALEQYPHAREYIEYWEEKNDGLESFFIKNLENVQGDERDVIFIGTVYGPESTGVPVMQRFGPINGVAGKRRLNVLFTRAKEQIVTFSSMTASDIKAEENGNPGVYMLKCWLEYSSSHILERGTSSNKEPDSEFEEYVIKQIRSIGCEAIPQVGVKGYSIDIGVRHPSWPHGFIMGVECDGATYHSSKSARDRDRLRQEVLERLGWHLYRIWSTDWFNDPRKETEKLRIAIEQRLKDLSST